MGYKHKIPHGLDHDLARRATARALESYRASFSEYKPRGEWVSEDRAEVAFTVAGRTLKGAVDVTSSTVDLELEVPFVFRPFKSIAIGVIENEIKDWINRARAGELDES